MDGLAVPDRPSRDEYDAIIVGSGLGGATAAALLAKAGLRTLMAERQEGYGGYAHAFQRGPYMFDPAVHVTSQGGTDGLMGVVLKHVGADDLCTMVPVDPLCDLRFPEFTHRSPASYDEFLEALCERFPGEASGMRTFMELCLQIHNDLHALPMVLNLKTLDDAAARFPKLFAYMRTTLREVVEECVQDPKARAVLCGQWPYVGVVPSRAGFVVVAQTLMNQLEGSWYPLGSFQKLVDALVAGVTRNGGEAIARNGARRIIVEDGAVAGVVLDSGDEIRAPTVISNADARQTLHTLVGDEHLPKNFLRRVDRMTPSWSAFVVFTATTVDVTQLDLAHETFLAPSWDAEGAGDDVRAGRPAGVWVTTPSAIDSSLAPPGEHLVTISSMATQDIGIPWEERRESFTRELLEMVEPMIPGLSDNLNFIENATPLTLERLTQNTGGAAYGWEQTPHQTGAKRLSHNTPIKGLYLSGHWTLPGSTSLRAFASGVHTAQIVLHETGAGEPIPLFAEANLPSAT